MLATTGTAPLSTSDTAHPSYRKASALLTDVLEEFHSMEMWFNTHLRTLQPNTDGRVLVPANTITCDPVDICKNYSIRGQYLFDNENFTFTINEPVECIVITDVPVQELPTAAYQYVRAKARYEYFLDEDGSTTKLQNYLGMYQQKMQDLVTTNLKLQDVNFFNSQAFLSFIVRRRGIGGRGEYSGRDIGERNLLGNYNTR